MADYKELIRKAIQALPENNGAARRAVYEKARAALVGQLRGLNPPLAARDITQHRLQLEDCIRQVEQEASEAVIAGLKQNEDLPPQRAALPPPRPASTMRPAASNTARPAPPPTHQVHGAPRPGPSRPLISPTAHPAAAAGRPLASRPQPASRLAAAHPHPHPQPKPAATAAVSAVRAATARPLPRVQPAAPAFQRAAPVPVPEYDLEEDAETIEHIIAAAETDTAVSFDDDEIDEIAAEIEPAVEFEDAPHEPVAARLEPRPSARRPALAAPTVPRAEARALPSIVARAEASKAGRGNPVEARRSNGVEPHHGANLPVRQELVVEPEEIEPAPRPSRDRRAHAALSSVREVELEHRKDGDPQLAIERAIATLEREARKDGDESGDAPTAEPGSDRASSRRRQSAGERGLHDSPDDHAGSDAAFARAPVEAERGGGNAITIFLLVFLVLLVGAGGGGYWAWHEGYIDFDAMFGKAQPVVEQASAPQAVPATPLPAATPPAAAAAAPANTVQTNTEAASNTPAQAAEALSNAPAPAAAAPVPLASAEPSAQSGSAPKSEDRLTQAAGDSAAPAVAALGTPADGSAASVPDGSHSLLLEASQDGTTGAVPFSGTVEWTKGTDEMGQPTLVGKANIPARNLGVSVLIRKNSDPALPASHLMEINFTVSDSFIGGAISGLPGVLLKNEELVQGTPLVGASARVVGNSFLFALSSSPADETTNQDLLTSRKWIDLAIIYATGKKAIITLEKDDKAEALFSDVFTAWGKVAAAPAAGK